MLRLGHRQHHWIGFVREGSSISEATQSVSEVLLGLLLVPLRGQLSTYPRYFCPKLTPQYLHSLEKVVTMYWSWLSWL